MSLYTQKYVWAALAESSVKRDVQRMGVVGVWAQHRYEFNLE